MEISEYARNLGEYFSSFELFVQIGGEQLRRKLEELTQEMGNQTEAILREIEGEGGPIARALSILLPASLINRTLYALKKRKKKIQALVGEVLAGFCIGYEIGKARVNGKLQQGEIEQLQNAAIQLIREYGLKEFEADFRSALLAGIKVAEIVLSNSISNNHPRSNLNLQEGGIFSLN